MSAIVRSSDAGIGMRSLLGMVLLLCGLTSGCSCQVVGLDVPGKPTSSTELGGQKQAPSAQPSIVDVTTSAKKYLVQGVATLTFYPKERTGQEGSFGGYVLMYDKAQETSVQFAALKEGQCQFLKTKRAEKRAPIDFQGIDLGRNITIRLSEHVWKWPRSPLQWGGQDAGLYYLGASVEKLRYPYEGNVSLQAEGGTEISAFSHKWKAPAHLTILQPKLSFTDYIRLSREKELPLKWSFVGKSPYLAVRINQSDSDGKAVRSLTCRFAAKGPGVIPVSLMSRFKTDTTGNNTHIFFFSGRYLLARLPHYDKPLFLVMEAISSSSVAME